MKKLLKGGRVVDPANGIDGVHDVLIDGDRIAACRTRPAGRRRDGRRDSCRTSSCVQASSTCTSTCASQDRSTRRRSRPASPSAVAGGFTAVACMPNTSPVNDNANVTSLILAKAAEAGTRARLSDWRGVEGIEGRVARRHRRAEASRLCRHHRRWTSGGDGAAAATRARVRRDVRHAGDRALRGPEPQGRRRRARGLSCGLARAARVSRAPPKPWAPSGASCSRS